ncbi:hypothetical protein V6N13_050954 [Hibiscus sabdariffa]
MVVSFFQSLFSSAGCSSEDPIIRGGFATISDVAYAELGKVGDGCSIQFWYDNWLGEVGPIAEHVIPDKQLWWEVRVEHVLPDRVLSLLHMDSIE